MPRILIVDDETMVRAFVERALGGAGYATTTAGNGGEALHVAARLGPFDAVISDVHMPDMDGFELARRLRLSFPGLPVLFLSGDSSALADDASPADAILAKPCSVAELRSAVDSLLNAA